MTGARARPATVDHVADFYWRYAGEVVALSTRVTVHEPQHDLDLRVTLPAGSTLEDYRPPLEMPGAVPSVEVDPRTQSNVLVWSFRGELPAGTCHEVQVETRIAPTARDVSRESQAVLTDGEHTTLAEETATIAIPAKGRYLRYLPELYEQDDFMARLLMLFESFWAPIETQIGSVQHYLNPEMTPPQFLPWLATWLDLALDSRLPEERRRRLLRAAVPLYRKRGTKQGLSEYLEIYTGGEARITEHRAWNLRLGPEARLGPGVALGLANVPHTFTIVLRLPPLTDGDEEDRARAEEERRRLVQAIIESEKPAHSGYTLRLETESELEAG